MTHTTRQIDCRGMIKQTIPDTKFKGFARCVIIVISHQKGIKPSDDESHQEHLPLETFRVVTFPAGIEYKGQQKEKQHLPYAPQYPFPLQGVLPKRHTDDDKGQQIQPYADEINVF